MALRVGTADFENTCSFVRGPLPRMHRYTARGVHRAFTAAAIRSPSMGDLVNIWNPKKKMQAPHLLIWNNLQDVLFSKEHTLQKSVRRMPLFCGALKEMHIHTPL